MSEGTLINNILNSAENIRASIQLVPYFISSLIIVVGIAVFIIIIVGHLGWIVLGLTVLVLVVEGFILRKMLKLHHEYVRVSDRRTSLLLICTELLIKLTQNGTAPHYFRMMD